MTIKSTYQAVEIIEELDGKYHNGTETLKAWAYLIKTKDYLRLHGWYGSNGTELIRMGYISETGRINWRYINATVDNAAEELGYA